MRGACNTYNMPRTFRVQHASIWLKLKINMGSRVSGTENVNTEYTTFVLRLYPEEKKFKKMGNLIEFGTQHTECGMLLNKCNNL